MGDVPTTYRPARTNIQESSGTPKLLEGLKKLVPRAAKRAAKNIWRAQKLTRAVREIGGLGPEDTPARSTLERLRSGWGNEDYSARVEYLEEILSYLDSTTGPVLECGSGLTTLLLGLLSRQRGKEVWTLEHDVTWQARVEDDLRRHGVAGVHLSLAPLVDYGRFSWYAPIVDLPSRFGLVICDGPPDSTPGGRYGLLPGAGKRMSAGTVILLDDASRESEMAVLDRWRAEAGWTSEIRGVPPTQYAVVRCV